MKLDAFDFPDDPAIQRRAMERVLAGQIELKPGDRVRLRPRQRGADIMDLALAGRSAVIAAIEQDYENRIHLAVTVDDDPGRDLGIEGKPGHRFYFDIDEVEPLAAGEPSAKGIPTILIAGIGNIFFGDDAFGCEVAQRLLRQQWPPGVRVVDFGIRGLDLTYALLDSHDSVILIDAAPRGHAPGTLSIIEPTLGESDLPDSAPTLDTHSMDLLKVLRAVCAMGGKIHHLRLLACEPSPQSGDAAEMTMGLSAPVAAAIEEALLLVRSLVDQLLQATLRAKLR